MRNNSNGTKTYFFMASDIQRGIDVVSWTGPPRSAAAAPAGASSLPDRSLNLGLLATALVALPLAAWVGRRRRAVGRLGWAFLFRL